MSTFKGVMVEFPDIQVDYFRIHPPPARPPLACFLSHIHSDHLDGLETFKGSFIWCSAITKKLLMKLEKRSHRLNFANGILESTKQQYKFMANRVMALPLETPTPIELEPHNVIQVTLFDANHCPGAVMFLFEQDQKAVLYTGDIRSEPWFVNNLIRNPFLIEYTSGMKTLDCIYLDTSNTDPIQFPTKAEGLKELIGKVRRYPRNTVFHLSAWTFGYEEVWMALSKALGSQVHLDAYKLGLYHSIPVCDVSTVMKERKVGNKMIPGFLTDDTHVQLHSCEKGVQCSEINNKTVFIRPIITRLDTGAEIEELGVGGGGGDLQPRPQLNLVGLDLDQFMSLFGEIDDTDVMTAVRNIYFKNQKQGRVVISPDDIKNQDDVSMSEIINSIMNSALNSALIPVKKEQAEVNIQDLIEGSDESHVEALPKVITFPYSRHSSYEELCYLVKAFSPKDVYPCTVDEEYWYKTGKSISSLFGKQCLGHDFRYDSELTHWIASHQPLGDLSQQSRATTQSSQNSPDSLPFGNQQREAQNSSPCPLIQPENIVRNTLSSTTWLSAIVAESSSAMVPQNKTNAGAISSTVNQHNAPPLITSDHSITKSPDEDNTMVETPQRLTAQTLHSGNTLRRNSKGQLRLFDEEGNELSIKALGKSSAVHVGDHPGTSWGDADATLNSTPPKNFMAESPGSDSQRLRRKIILDDLDKDGAGSKRVRRSYDPYSMPSTDYLTTSQDERRELDLTPLENPPILLSDHDSVLPDRPSIREKSPKRAPVAHDIQMASSLLALSSFLQSNDEANDHANEKPDGSEKSARGSTILDGAEDQEIITEELNLSKTSNNTDKLVLSENFEGNESQIEEAAIYFDKIDNVYRCNKCEHELWGDCGYCTGCGDKFLSDADDTNPYFEIGSEDENGAPTGPCPLRIAVNEYDEEIEDEAVAQEVAGDYLDNDPEAYDTQDSCKDLDEDYDLTDAFIDDGPQYETDSESSDQNSDGESDGETDYKAKYKALQVTENNQLQELQVLRQSYEQLAMRYDDMEASFTDLKRDCGVDSESEREYDDEGNLIVEVSAPEVSLAEILVSDTSEDSSQEATKEIVSNQAAEQSQNSVLDTQRIEDRVRGFEAAQHGAWSEVNLMSTGANHGEPEEEL